MEFLMLDIETLGNKPNSVILSISAVQFNRAGELGDRFHVDIDPKSCVEHGLEMDVDTVLWWLKQSDEARAQFTDGRERASLRGALEGFKQWAFLKKAGGDFEKVFAKDPDFDCTIIENACNRVGINPPFSYREKVAIRTLSWLRPNFEADEKFTGTPHNGIDDCEHQIKYVVKILQDLDKDVPLEELVTVNENTESELPNAPQFQALFQVLDLFEVNDIIAKKEDILQYKGNLPKDKTFIVTESGLLNLHSDTPVDVNEWDLFGKLCSVMPDQ